jgi:hypothetical protein
MMSCGTHTSIAVLHQCGSNQELPRGGTSHAVGTMKQIDDAVRAGPVTDCVAVTELA